MQLHKWSGKKQRRAAKKRKGHVQKRGKIRVGRNEEELLLNRLPGAFGNRIAALAGQPHRARTSAFASLDRFTQGRNRHMRT